MNIYLAGSLFSEGEIRQRKLEGELLRTAFPNDVVCNPIDQPFNANKASLPTPQTIYNADEQAIVECDVLIADVTNEDPGVMLAIGLAIRSMPKIIIAINSDARLATANQYDIPSYGMNHFVLGAILEKGYLVHSIEEAIQLIKQIIE